MSGAEGAAPQSVLDDTALDRLRRIGGDKLLHAMAQLFLENGAQRVEALRQAAREDDAATIGRTAHALKSSAGTLGAHRLMRLAAEVERAASEGHEAQAIGAAAELAAAFDEAALTLRRRLELEP